MTRLQRQFCGETLMVSYRAADLMDYQCTVGHKPTAENGKAGDVNYEDYH